MGTFGSHRILRATFAEALDRVVQALRAEGFGILTEIDVKDTLKKKLDVDLRRYRILGACNPPLAHRALQLDPEVGLLLPCNVIVYEEDEGRTVVSVIDPLQTVAARSASPELREVAGLAAQKLRRVLAHLAEAPP